MNEKIVLIDGHSILNRAFYGVPDLTNGEGLHTNAIYGFLNIMFKILEEEKPGYLVVAFDVKAPTFRHEMYEQYKGTRKPMPEELREQVPVMKEVLKAMNVTILEMPGFEADDILGTIAKKGEAQGIQVSLVSGDRDLLQLASEMIKIRIPKTKMGGTEVEDYNTQDVINKYGVTPLQIIDLKGLMGDASDNIPGVPGIGEKRASSIISAFGSVEGAIEHIEEVTPPKARENLREFYEQAILSKKLATIDTAVPVSFGFEEALIGDFYTEEAFRLVKRLEFKTYISRFSSDVGRNENLEKEFVSYSKKEDAISFLEKMLVEAGDTIGLQVIQEVIDNNHKYAGNYGKETSGQYCFSFLDQEAEKPEAGEPVRGFLGISFSYALASSDLDAGGKTKTGFIFINDEIQDELVLKFVTRIVEAGKKIAIIDLKSQLNILPFHGDAFENTKGSIVSDLAIGAYIINPLQDTYDYSQLASQYLGQTLPGQGELLGKNSFATAAKEMPEQLKLLGSYGSYVALKACKPILERLKVEGAEDLFYTIEMPLVYTLYDMELRGIMVNRKALKEYGEQLVDRIQELEGLIYELAGETFNINSPKQLGVILFEKLKLPFGKKTKTGYSTSAEVLEKLKVEDPIVNFILEYRQLTKLKSTYADGLGNYISEVDERIHGKFNQTITATGRISSTEPNLQNIPIRMELGRQIRKVFIPKEGFIFLDADYSQIELRVLAHMSGDEMLIEAYKNAEDIHKITASQVFHTPLDEVTSLQRSNAKAVNFGIVYGISSFGLGQDLNISRKEAEGYIHKYFETYPKVKEFLDELVEKGKKEGYVTTLFQRRRPIPELSSSNFMQRSFGERVAMNSPIQGTAADIIKIAMIRVNQRLKKENLKSSLILQVHDELLIETALEEKDQVEAILREEMLHAAELAVTLEVDVNQGNNWYEAK